MGDNEDPQKKLKEQLEAERQKLTEVQREEHDRYSARLEKEGIYRLDIALKATRVIRTEEGPHKDAELRSLTEQAQRKVQEERQAAKAEAERRKEYLAEKAERDKQAREKDLEKQRQREQKERDEKQRAAKDAARAEPVPGVMQKFNALLAQKKAERDAQAKGQGQEQGGNKSSPLLDKGQDKSPGRGEVSDSRAEKFARMFDKSPSRDKGFDATHDPNNSHNFAPGRGGRGGR
jgi:hypothetical protein